MSYPFATATATILRAIKAGKVSGTKDGSGQIETAELHGIYPRNGADTDAAVELAWISTEPKWPNVMPDLAPF